MRAEQYFLSFRRALFKLGIMGQPVARLVAELRDHLALKQIYLIGAGEDVSCAEAKACAALGDPEVVADRAAKTLQQGCWMARRPICCGLVFGIGALLINLLTVITVEIICETFLKNLTDSKWIAAQIAVEMMNWLPIILGFGLLAWIARRRAIGWGPLIWGACLLVFFTSFIGFWEAFRPQGFESSRNQVCLTFEGFPWSVWSCLSYRFNHQGPIRESIWEYFFHAHGIYYSVRLLLTLAVLPIFRYGPSLIAYFFRKIVQA